MEFTDVAVKLSAIYYYSVPLVLLAIFLLLLVLWNLRKNGKRYANLPSYHNFLFEVVYEFLTNKTKSLPITTAVFQKIDDVCRQFEKEGMVHIWCFRHILLICGEEAVKVFATDEASADKSADYILIKEAFGEGLQTSNGETWKKDRKLLNPVFHIGVLKTQIPIFNENAKIFVKKLAIFVDKPVVDLHPCLECLAFHNLCESIFGVNMKDEVNETEIERLYTLIKELQKYMGSRWVLPPVIANLHKYCTPNGWRKLKMYKEAKQFALKIISSAIESFSRKSRDSDKGMDLNQKSFFPILLEQQLKGPSLITTYVQDHVGTILAAGMDTFIITTMWCLYLMGLYKDVQEKAYDEVQSVADEFMTYENLCRLEYLECIIKETLRLYPTGPIFSRHLKKDLQCGKYTVPKDTTIVFFLYRLHRNSEIYADPENFDPDRFLSTNTDKRKWAHIPFSEGYRNCIGKKFAMMQMKVTLAHILRNYEITSLDRREDLDLSWNFTLMPSRRLRMRIKRR